jgi:cyclopropane fatty-acyl-phospholipid synthase-like methyltransferase
MENTTKEFKRHALVGPPKLWKMKQKFQIEFLKEQGLHQSNKLLDIGCGTLRGGIPLIKFLNEGNYFGIEVREKVLAEGLQELKYYNLEYKNPHLVHFFQFKDLDFCTKFDIIFAFSVFIHFKDSIIEECFDFISKYLTTKGSVYANVNIGSKKEGSWQGFPVVWRPLDFYKNLAETNGLVLSTVGKLGSLGHNSMVESQDNQLMIEIKQNSKK